MTQIEFIKSYCEKSNITEERLNELGQFSVPCDCKEEGCNGWAMVSRALIKQHTELCIDGIN